MKFAVLYEQQITLLFFYIQSQHSKKFFYWYYTSSKHHMFCDFFTTSPYGGHKAITLQETHHLNTDKVGIDISWHDLPLKGLIFDGC